MFELGTLLVLQELAFAEKPGVVVAKEGAKALSLAIFNSQGVPVDDWQEHSHHADVEENDRGAAEDGETLEGQQR